MTKVAIPYCENFEDHSCVACAKYHKGMVEKTVSLQYTIQLNWQV